MATSPSRPQPLVACALGCVLSLEPAGASGADRRAASFGQVEPRHAAPLDRGAVAPVAVADDWNEPVPVPIDAATRYALTRGASRAPEPRIAGRPRTGKGLLIAGGAVLGAGIAMTIVFGSLTRGCREEGPLACRYRGEDTFLLPLGITVITTGIMLMSVGGGYLGHYRRWQKRAVANTSTSTRFLPMLGRGAERSDFVAPF